jgi:hypothetical protein
VRSGPGAARTILLSHIISARPSKQPLMVRTIPKGIYMELGSYFLFLQEQIKDIINLTRKSKGWHNIQEQPYNYRAVGDWGARSGKTSDLRASISPLPSLCPSPRNLSPSLSPEGPSGGGRVLWLCHAPKRQRLTPHVFRKRRWHI